MIPSKIRSKLARGETAICAKCNYQDPDIVEVIGSYGFDGIWICQEHRRFDPLMLHHLIRAARLSGMEPIVRVKPANYSDVLWLLEAGVRGIMLPRITRIDEASELVSAMKFPPEGIRGYDGVQADSEFGRIPGTDYITQANQGNFLVAQIEEPAIVPRLDELAALPGVDVLFVGPGDLTLSLGKLGKVDDPEITDILHRVVAACHRHGKAAGIPCSADQVHKYHAMGFRFFNVVSDYRCLIGTLTKVQDDLSALGFALNNKTT